MKRMGKLNAKTSLRVLAAVGLLGTAISCGDMLKKKDDDKNNPPPPEKKTTPIAQFKVTSVAEGLTAAVAAEKTADGTAAVLKVTDIVAGSQLIAVSGTCPIGSFTAEGEYTTGAIKADCEVVLKAGATASFAFTADKLPKDGQAQFTVVPFGAFNLKKVVAGDCPTVGAWQGNNYSVPVTAACTATFEALAAPYHLTGSANTKVVPTTAQHKFSVTITPSLTDLVEGSAYAIKFDGAAAAAITAGKTPSYKIKNVISTTCPAGSLFDYANQIYRIAPLAAGTASCDVSFEVENPCGDAGVDASLIRYTGATASARIDRIITKTTTDIETGVKGVGTESCANGGCHGQAAGSLSTAQFRWKIPYSPIITTAYTSATAITEGSTYKVIQTGNATLAMFAADGTAANNDGKFIQGTSGSSWIQYDPLNSRFYRKVTPGYNTGGRMPKVFSWNGTGSVSANCTPSNGSDYGGTCLSQNQASQICHWIWNGVPY